MTADPHPDEPGRPDAPDRKPLPVTSDQRRLYRPDSTSDERRTIFTDWASI